jgi:hypothetical protein
MHQRVTHNRNLRYTMELLISLPDETELIHNDQLGELPKELIDDLREFGDDPDFKSLNIGPGADWIVVLAIFSSLFFLGEKIEKNLSAWLKLGKKIKSLFKKYPKKWIFIDERGASALCLIDVEESEKEIKSIEEIGSNEIRLLDIHASTLNYKEEYVKMNPYSIYNKTFLVNDNKYYLYVIMSNGEIQSKTTIDSYYMDAMRK